jgi:hypothetical protein
MEQELISLKLMNEDCLLEIFNVEKFSEFVELFIQY